MGKNIYYKLNHGELAQLAQDHRGGQGQNEEQEFCSEYWTTS